MTAPQSTPLPPAPQRNEPEDVFIPKSNTFVAALEPHRVELQAQADFVDDKSAEADASASEAKVSELLALSSGNYIGVWADLTGSVAAGVSVAHNGQYWGSLVSITDITLAEPSISADWQAIGGELGTAAVVDTGTAQNEIELNSQKTFKSFDSLTSAIAFVTANPDTIERLSTASYRDEAECTTLGIAYPDGGGADYVVVPAGTGVDDGGSFIDAGTKQLGLVINGSVNFAAFGGISSPSAKVNSIAFGLASGAKILFTEDTTINIPTDSPVIQTVLDVVMVDKISITINIESGHKLTNGWKIRDGDYSDFTITSVDEFVTLDAGFTPVTTISGPGSLTMVAVYHNVRAPIWDVLLDGEGAAELSAISNSGGSTLNVLTNKGAVRFLNNYLGSSSTMWADFGKFYEAGYRGIWATSASTIYARSVDCNGCADIGFFMSRAGKAEIDSSNVSGCLTGLRSSSASCVMAQTLNASNCTSIGVVATFAGIVYIGASTVTGCGLYNLLANDGGKIDAANANVSNSLDINVNANTGGHISLQNATATGGVTYDLSIAQGGYIYAQGCNGLPRVPANALTARGVIFQ